MRPRKDLTSASPSTFMKKMIVLCAIVLTSSLSLAKTKPAPPANDDKVDTKAATEAPADKGADKGSADAKAATAGKSDDKVNPESDKLDVSDLEKKYWAAKDTDFNVVQNRTYTKAGRYAISLGFGPLLNDSWSEAVALNASASYYFSDRYGAELMYSYTDTKNSASTDRLISQGGVPNHGKVKTYIGGAFNWVPIYAKMSVMNKSIIYFDMSFSPTLGMTTYEQQTEDGGRRKTSPTIGIDITQHFFLSKFFALRGDFKNRWYQEDIAAYRNSTAASYPDRKIDSSFSRTSEIIFGATFYF